MRNIPVQPARRRFLAASAATTLTATALPALATDVAPARRARAPARPPRPLLQSPPLLVAPGAERPVVLQALRIDADVAGRLAQTTVEMTFHNPNRRVLEGELQFPLLDGQRVVGFALDIDGELRDAVPIDKVRGRQVFEDIVRGQIDPGLLQQSAGNHYTLRVYPLPPGGTRTVRIRCVESLRSSASGARRHYRVPLGFAERVDALALTVRVAAADMKPVGHVASADAPTLHAPVFGRIAFERAGSAWIAQAERDDVALAGQAIELAVDAARGTHVAYCAFAGATYFAADVPVRTARAPRPAPRRVLLAWDSSGSGAQRDHARELALLGAWFRRIGARQPELRVDLVRLRDTAEPPRSFNVIDGRWDALRRALVDTAWDGATDLGALPWQPGAADVVLLFSDGLSNYGARRLPEVDVPLFAIVSSAGADTTRLRHAAERSGGRLVDLSAADADVATVAESLATTTTRLVAIDAHGAADVVAVSPYPRDGRLELVGRLPSPGDASAKPVGAPRLLLTVAHADGRRERIDVPLAPAAPEGDGKTVPLAALLWAQARIDGLDRDDEAQRAEARRIATSFGIATQDTALIVLERPMDYARHDIDPPAGTALAAQVAQVKKTLRFARERDEKAQLERVVRIFSEKQTWWHRAFPKDDPPLEVARGKREAMRDEARRSAEAPIAASAGPLEDARRRESERRAPGAPPAPLMQLRKGLAARADVAAAPAASAADSAAETTATIRLQRWTPDAPYLARMRAASGADLYRAYLAERPAWARSTAFFLDAADLLFERGERALARRVLSNLAELALDNRHVLRILGLRLLQAGDAHAAVHVLREVRAMAPDEPQSWRDLGLALAAAGEYQQAIDTLYEVIVRPWHGRFPEIELITLAELNAIVATAPGRSATDPTPLDTRRIDPRLAQNLPLDLRVVLTWDADNTDIDLWVTDPNGERAFYGNRLTWQGGRMSMDFTGGYGPEEFSLRQAKPGRYRVEANFFGHRQQIVAGATTLQVTLTTGFGTPHARAQAVTLRLRDKGTVFVGEFDVAPAAL